MSGDSYGTPLWLYNLLNAEFCFAADMFADNANHLHQFYFSESAPYKPGDLDGYPFRTVFANPPYSAGNIGRSMALLVDLIPLAISSVALVRADSSTAWWQNYVDGVASEVRDLPLRLKFRGGEGVYNFPCCIVIYRPGPVQTHRFLWRELAAYKGKNNDPA